MKYQLHGEENQAKAYCPRYTQRMCQWQQTGATAERTVSQFCIYDSAVPPPGSANGDGREKVTAQ